MMELPLLPEMKELFPESAGYKSISTSEPILSWSSFEYTHPLNSSSTTTSTTHTIGIIRLDSFKPTIETQEGTIRLIRQLLLGPLSSTTALIFDCRDNGGGLISLADGIPQLFVPDFIPGGARALIAPINEQIFTGPLKNDPWAKAYSEAKPGDKYSNIIQFTPTIKANNQGQVYFKPVGVLNNGQCYSACDLFSAAMQDSGAAIIFGEDPQTGAGGANVVEHEDFFVKTLPSVFKKLPGNQNMRLAFRQSGKSSSTIVCVFLCF